MSLLNYPRIPWRFNQPGLFCTLPPGLITHRSLAAGTEGRGASLPLCQAAYRRIFPRLLAGRSHALHISMKRHKMARPERRAGSQHQDRSRERPAWGWEKKSKTFGSLSKGWGGKNHKSPWMQGSFLAQFSALSFLAKKDPDILGTQVVSLLRGAGFWQRFPVLTQPLGAWCSVLLRIWPPGSKQRAVQIQELSFHQPELVFSQRNTEASPSTGRFLS